MAKLTTSDLTSLVNETSAVSTINNNFAAVETAMEKTLSRDGTTPNQMEATLDMNSNPIINLRTPVSDSEAVRKDYVDDLIEDIVEDSTETLDDLLDVIITSPTVGQVLSFNGTNWINDGASASADLNALSDVVITSALAGQYLQYNGTNWINVTEYVRDITKAPYNADNTGATSAVTAIQAAIDDGGLIYAPAGAYRIDSTININNPCTIVGEGDDKTGNAATGTRFNVHGDAVNAFHVKANNVFMEKFTVQGQGGTRNSANTNGRGVIVGTSDTAAATITTIAGNTTVTAASSIFTAADVGKYVRIVGAGSQGSSNNHYSYIVSQSGTTAVLNDAPTVSVVGTSMKYGINAFNFVGRDITVYNHGVGIEFRSHNRYKLNHCMILGYDAIWSNNDIAIDSGDSTIVHCHTTANSVAGVGIVHNSGGGLRISDTKLLTSFNAIKSTWVDGISGGFILTGNSIENVTGDCISINGDGGDAQIIGLTMTGNWINGGTGQIKIADNIIVTDLNVVGNNIINGSATNMITIGALVNGFNVSANNMNGNSGTVTGILVNSGASNGILANNRMYNCTTRVTNNGTAVYKFDTLNNGVFDVTRLNVAAGSTSATAIGKTGDDNCGIYFPANDKVGIVTGGAERFRMTNTGMIIDPNGVTSDPAVTFHVRTGTDHNYRVSNTGEGVSVQVLNDAVNAYTDLDFTGRTVYFKHLGQTKLATTTAGLNVLNKNSTITISIASPGVVTWASHGLSAGDMFYFTTTGALPTGISANTSYFVIATGLTTNTFQFSATSGGSAVNTSGTQSGTHTASRLGVLVANTIELGNLSDTTISRSAAGRVAVEGINLAQDTFLQQGTGAVTRTLQDKNRDWISVKDFGAAGDGTTTDTTAIQNAINFAATLANTAATSTMRGGIVYFPPGDYKTGALTLKNGVTLLGSGHGATSLRNASPATAAYLIQTENYDILTGTDAWFYAETVSAVSAATNANPAVFTIASHVFTNKVPVTATGFTGGTWTTLNGNTYYVGGVSGNNFSLYTDKALTTPVDGTALGTFTAGTLNFVPVPNNFEILHLSIDGGAYPPTSFATDRGGIRIYGKGYRMDVLVHNTNGVGIWTECGSQVGQYSVADLPETVNRARVYRCGGHGIVDRGPHDFGWDYLFISQSGAAAGATAADGYGYKSEYLAGSYGGHGEINKIHSYANKGPGVYWERRHKCNIVIGESNTSEGIVIAGDDHSSVAQMEVYSNNNGGTGITEQIRISANKVTIGHIGGTPSNTSGTSLIKVTGDHVNIKGIEYLGDAAETAIVNEGSYNNFEGFVRNVGTGVSQASGATDNSYDLKIRTFSTMFNALGQYSRCKIELDAVNTGAATIWGGTAPTSLTQAQYRSCSFDVTANQNSTAYQLRNGYGTQSLWIPATAMIARTTNGAAAGSVETTTNKIMINTWDFDAATAEYVQYRWRPPTRWDLGTVTAKFYWSHAATATNFGVAWAVDGVAMSDNEAIDAAFGTAQASVDTGGTTNNLYISPSTSAITIAGSPAQGDEVILRFWRNAAGGSDTMTIDARLHGVELFWNSVADNDF